MSTDVQLVPELIETTGAHSGRTHRLPYGDHLVGRGTDASIVLDHNDVSRRHARLEVGPEGVTVHDLGSKNGIYVDGKRIGQPRLLRHGDRFRFGDLELTVSHPASQVKGVLSAAGETTLTITHSQTDEARSSSFIVLPIAGVVVFGVLVVVLLML